MNEGKSLTFTFPKEDSVPKYKYQEYRDPYGVTFIMFNGYGMSIPRHMNYEAALVTAKSLEAEAVDAAQLTTLLMRALWA